MKNFERLIKAFRRFPGVGPRQAERFSAFILRSPQAVVEELLTSVKEARARLRLCARCFNWAENELCDVCADDTRDAGLICVVEEPQDIEALEKTHSFKGYYHVLGGAISHNDGSSPDQLRIKELMAKVKNGGISEVVIATDPDAEGETTAMYLAREIHPLGVKTTRIAYGVPLGGDIDYTDELTLACALKGRTEI